VELYEDAGLDKRNDSGERFKRTLEKYFPWSEEPDVPGAITGRHAAEVLYNAFRCPLAHSLGVYDGPYLGTIKLAKGPLPEEAVEDIERARSRPSDWTRSTLSTDSPTKGNRTKTLLIVKCLYWGVRQTIYNVLDERSRSARRITSPAAYVTREKVTVTATAATTFRTGTAATTYEQLRTEGIDPEGRK
jgi:hypothetical protein